MARFFTQHSLLPSLLFLCYVVSSCSARLLQVGDICSKHPEPPTCVTILYSMVPGVALGADLDSLSRYIISQTNTNAFDTLSLVTSLVQNATDSQLKQRYVTCSNCYSNVVSAIEHAGKSLKSGDYEAIKSDSGDVMRGVLHCYWTSPHDSLALANSNKYLQDVNMIIGILADFLAGKY